MDNNPRHDDSGHTTKAQDHLLRRDRHLQAFCEGEPETFDPTFQAILEQAYWLKEEGRTSEIYSLLVEHAHLPSSSYQETRTNYLFGEYYAAMEQELDKQEIPEHERQQDYLGKAADHYARAADIAREIPDMALCAQLKAMECKVCYFSHPNRKRYRRALEAAKAALEAWKQLPDRMIATDMEVGFTLGDLLATCAQLVGDDVEAVQGLNYARQCLKDVQNRPDCDVVRYANNELFLDWNLTYLDISNGRYREAFKKAREMRKRGLELLTNRNRARFQYHIANIMLAYASDGGIGDYSLMRLVAASERATTDAYKWDEAARRVGKGDRATRALILLAEARWMALKEKPRTKQSERTAKIEEALQIALLLDDTLLLGQVEIAWGDEYAVQWARRPSEAKKRRVEMHYLRAMATFEQVDALSLARIARTRLEQFRNPPSGQSGQPPSEK